MGLPFQNYYIENLSGHMLEEFKSYINIQSKDIQIGDNSGNANTYDSLNANFLLKTKNNGYIIKTDTIDLTNNFKIKLMHTLTLILIDMLPDYLEV